MFLFTQLWHSAVHNNLYGLPSSLFLRFISLSEKQTLRWPSSLVQALGHEEAAGGEARDPGQTDAVQVFGGIIFGGGRGG